MSEKRKIKVKSILNDLQIIFEKKEDIVFQQKIHQNSKEAFEQMCYYQGYQDKKDKSNMMTGEYLRFKGIYLCYKDPKMALMALQKGILCTTSQKGIINHFLRSDATAFFRQKGFFKTITSTMNKLSNDR